MFKILRQYWRHLRHYAHYWLPMLITVPVASVLNNFALAYIVAGVIDRLSRGTVPLSQVWSVFGADIIAFAVCVVVGELVLWRLNVFLVWSLEARMVQRLYGDAFDHLSQQSATFFSDRFVGSLVSAVTKYTSSYVVAADAVIFQIMPLAVAVVVPIIVLGPTVPLFALGVAVVTAAFITVSMLSYRSITVWRRWSRSCRPRSVGDWPTCYPTYSWSRASAARSPSSRASPNAPSGTSRRRCA